MIASHQAVEITFYEELGVAPNASHEEIRDAFRALVRLLHPDQQTDPQLKDIAEKQMRKVNRIYAVLSDPDRRQRYDDFLEEDDEDGPRRAPGPVLRPEIARLMAKSAWAAAIVASAGLLIWWLTAENMIGPQTHSGDPVASPAAVPASLTRSAGVAADQSSLIANLRSDLKAVTLERDAAIHELARLRGTEPAPSNPNPPRSDLADTSVPAIALTELPNASKLPLLANAPLSRIERPANQKLAGFWFYAKPASGQHNKNQALYPPEYIELTISEQTGTINGKYRARFQVVDRAISPDVNFTFAGPSTGGPQATVPWTGAGGAKGEAVLKLVSENSLRIDWTATDLGTQQGLDSGTAILRRRIE